MYTVKKQALSEETKRKLLGGCKSPTGVMSVYAAWKYVPTSLKILAELKYCSNLREEIKCVANASFASTPAANFARKQMPKIREHFRERNPLVVCAVASEYVGKSMDVINAPKR